MSRKSVFALILALLASALLINTASAVQYKVSVVTSGAVGYGINNNNLVTGSYHGAPVIWDLNTNSPVATLSNGHGCDINDTGNVALEYADKSYFWDYRTICLQFNSYGSTENQVRAINNRNQLVGYSKGVSNYYCGFVFSPAQGLTNIVAYGKSTFAYGINNYGKVVGSYSTDTGSQAFVWSESAGAQTLSNLGGGHAQATDINDAGLIVGSSSNGSNICATLWHSNGTPENLGLLGAISSSAYKINLSGTVIGILSYADSTAVPFVWDQAEGMRKLPLPEGYSQYQAMDINNEGWIIGFAQTGSDQGYRTDMILWQPVPEPSSIIALLSGICGLGGMIIRKKK